MVRMLWIIAIYAGNALGAARSPDPGNFQLFTSLTNYRASHLFERDGDRRRFPNNGEFSKQEIDATILYGHDPRWAWIGGLSAAKVRYEDADTTEETTILGEARLGARRQLHAAGDHVLAAQLMVIQPGWGENVSPQPGIRQHAVELRGLWDWSLWHHVKGAFFSLEAAYRSYTGTAPDQTRLEPTLLWRHGAWVPMLQWTWIRALRDGETQRSDDIFASRSYTLHKGTLGLAYQLAPAHHLQASFARDMAGRDVGSGEAISLNWWWQP